MGHFEHSIAGADWGHSQGLGYLARDLRLLHSCSLFKRSPIESCHMRPGDATL